MAMNVLSFLASLSLFTGLSITEQGSLTYWTFLVSLCLVHRFIGIFQGREGEREERLSDQQKGVRSLKEAVERQQQLMDILKQYQIKRGA